MHTLWRRLAAATCGPSPTSMQPAPTSARCAEILSPWHLCPPCMRSKRHLYRSFAATENGVVLGNIHGAAISSRHEDLGVYGTRRAPASAESCARLRTACLKRGCIPRGIARRRAATAPPADGPSASSRTGIPAQPLIQLEPGRPSRSCHSQRLATNNAANAVEACSRPDNCSVNNATRSSAPVLLIHQLCIETIQALAGRPRQHAWPADRDQRHVTRSYQA